jgi:hypothetical protein
MTGYLFEEFPDHSVPLPGLWVDGAVAVGDRDAVVEPDNLGDGLTVVKLTNYLSER